MTLRSLASERSRDVRGALTTMPGWRTWRRCAFVYCLFLVCAAPLGVVSGLIRPSAPHLLPRELLAGGFMLFVHPSLVEEIVFRGLVLPRDASSMRRSRLVLVAGVALAVYVASHPLNAWLFRPQVRSVFDSPAYLALAALLGLTCTTTYLISRSIWPPVAIHWLTVVAWIWLLGGQALLC